MTSSGKPILLPKLAVSAFFILYFLYFAILNRYSLAYQEQIQLFRFEWRYFTDFLSRPGGFVNYLSAFLIQFWLYHVIAVLIVTFSGITVYSITNYILKKYNVPGVFWNLLPVIILAVLHSDYTYSMTNTLGFILALSFFALYISIRKPFPRYLTGFILWIIVYLAIGGFSMLVAILCIIHELFFSEDRYRFFAASGFALWAAFIPWLAWYLVYYIPLDHAWLSTILFPVKKITLYALLLMFAYIPSLLIIKRIWSVLSEKTQIFFGWNWKTMGAGMIIFSAFTWVIIKYAYDPKSELLFRIDNCIQKSEWEKALRFSSEYPGSDRLSLYFTNLALYESGRMGDEMFHYKQRDASHLWLAPPETQFPYFFGCDIFYHLGYINKAYAWAYDAMVITGYAPRLLKQLVMTSLINGNNAMAEKFLDILDESLFYRKWASHYKNYINDHDLQFKDPEISNKRQLLIHADFVGNTNDPDSVLVHLLLNHPDNKMAYEYFMASLLLDKNVTAFATNAGDLKYYGYKEIPVHYEEALLEYMYSTKKEVVPQGYSIRQSTVKKFNDFVSEYTSYSGDPGLAARMMYKSFGTTYWYYLNFVNNRAIIR